MLPPGHGHDFGLRRISWTPGAADVGLNEFRVRARSFTGQYTDQVWVVDVEDVPEAPQILSSPNTSLVVGAPWQYEVEVQDQDHGAVVGLVVVQGPTSMVLVDRVLSWTPTEPDVGLHPVTIRATDETGRFDEQSFDLVVVPFQNNAPFIDSVAVTLARQDDPYTYIVTASDPDYGDQLEFRLATGPAGMSIDAVSGQLAWTPTAQQVRDHDVRVVAVDLAGEFSAQDFVLRVLNVNDAPRIVSTAPTEGLAGQRLTYVVRAEDDDGDRLTFALPVRPTGMTIDGASGILRWTPTAAGTFDAVVGVQDPARARAEQAFTVTVAPETEAPTVGFFATPEPADVGQTVTITVNATDNVGVSSRTLTVAGSPVSLDAHHRGQYTPTAPGLIAVEATATDPSGNVGSATGTLSVRDPTDTTPPVVSIASPANYAEITAPTDILGTVGDGNLASYELAYEGDASGSEILAVGTANISNGLIGQLDPTLLENGLYTLTLTATDVNGATTSTSAVVQVEGGMKVGVFRVSFTDLQVPVSGIPIAITRTYDSRKKTADDLGVGWSLDVASGRVQHKQAVSAGWQIDPSQPPWSWPCSDVRELGPHATEVRLSESEAYTFKPVVRQPSAVFGGCMGEIAFEQTGGTTPGATLQVIGNAYFWQSQGTGVLLDDDTRTPLRIEHVQLTTYDGRVVDVHLDDGTTRLADRNGNELYITRSGIAHSSGESVVFNRDSAGRITSIVDPSGRTLTYDYDGAGDLIRFTNRASAAVQYRYDTHHFLEEIIDPLGISVARNEYDADGRLTATIDPDGNRVEFTHDVAQRRETITNRNGYSYYFDYDEGGNVVTETYPGTPTYTVSRTFDDEGRPLTVTNEENETTTYTYDAYGNKLTETNAENETQTWTYNPDGTLASYTNAANEVETYAYDQAGNEVMRTDAAGHEWTKRWDDDGDLIRDCDPRGYCDKFMYFQGGNVYKLRDKQGTATVYTYDGNGNVLTETSTRTVNSVVETMVTTYVYDDEGRVTETVAPDGSISTTEYNAAGQMEARVDGLGYRTEYEYDNQGRQEVVRYPDGTYEETVYDDDGKVTSRTDRGGLTTSMVYDVRGRMTSRTRAGETTTFTYDGAGRRLTMTDAENNTRSLVYDDAGRLTTTTNPDFATRTTVYGASGRVDYAVDEKSRTTNYTYDARGLLTRIDYHDGTHVAWTYDDAGNQLTATDEQGRTTSYVYDGAGNLTSVTNPDNETWTYEYDAQGNLERQIDPLNHITRYGYDAMGRETKRQFGMVGPEQTRSYDLESRLSTLVDYSGLPSTEYVYDTQGRLTQRRQADGQVFDFGYAPSGQRRYMTDSRGVTWYDYDSQDRLERVTDPKGRTIEYVYDGVGNMTSRTVTTRADTWTEDFTYDAMNRIETVATGTLTWSMTYDATGQLETLSFPNGLTTTYGYDDRDRVLSIVTEDLSSNVVASFVYTRLLAGNIETVTEADGTTKTYTYDLADRLTSERIEDGLGAFVSLREYEYDDAGNRVRVDFTPAGGPTETRIATYDSRDRIQTDGSVSFTWDVDGRMTSKSGTEGYTLTWDSEDRLLRIDYADGSVLENVYDADGERVAESYLPVVGSPVDYDFVLDTSGGLSHILGDIDPVSDAMSRRYVRRQDQMVGTLGQGRLFPLADHLGSVRHWTDTFAATTTTIDYWPYGVPNGPVTAGAAYLFAGERFDPRATASHNRARWALPAIGAFPTIDPWQGSSVRPITLHSYVYAAANPSSYSDPTGLVAFSLGSINVTIEIQGNLSIISHGHSLRTFNKFRHALATRKTFRTYREAQRFKRKMGLTRGANRGRYEAHKIFPKSVYEKLPDKVRRSLTGGKDDWRSLPAHLLDKKSGTHQTITNAWDNWLRMRRGNITLEDAIDAASKIYPSNGMMWKEILIFLIL
jgi:RHS repeat-associated protein